ncbi:MAG: hypothetical protein LBB05_04250 [Puniceicoccales bacterium]|jgi:hypothetical protein|nr:hypothetical protein [Puniceicoccales bacterium]
MLSYLLSIFKGKWLTHYQTKARETGAVSSSAAIRVNTSRLPKAFREKFRLGKCGIKQDRESGIISGNAPYEIGYAKTNSEQILPNGVIDESEGDIKIMCFNLELRDQTALMEAIQNDRKTKNGNSVESFLKNFTKKSLTGKQKLSKNEKGESVMYLEVGNGVYWHLERFERLIVAQDGEIKKNLVYGDNRIGNGGKIFDRPTSLRGKFEAKMRNIRAEIWNGVRVIGDYFASDDSNIQNELKTNYEFCDAFYKGRAKIIVYHRAVQSLTLLCFEQHDERVAAIDRKRDFFVKSKNIIGFAMCSLIFHVTNHVVSSIPFLGNYLGMICRFVTVVTIGMALYRSCQLLPVPWRVSMSNFVDTKIGPHLPIWRMWRKRVKTIIK